MHGLQTAYFLDKVLTVELIVNRYIRILVNTKVLMELIYRERIILKNKLPQRPEKGRRLINRCATMYLLS